MRHLYLALLVLAALSVAPSAAGAAVEYRCTAAALSGSVLGTPLPVPTAGSTTEPCANDSTLPTVSLPAPLSSLVTVNAVNGVTTFSDKGAFAGGGIGNLKLGTIPVALPLPDIAIPTELTTINLSLPGLGGVIDVKVDLTPAVTAALDALKNRESKSLLDVGVAYATAYGACTTGAPTVGGAARVADASVLGQPLNLSQTTDQAINLVDTSNLDLSSLNLNLATVSASVAGIKFTLSSAQLASVLSQVQAGLPKLPPVSIPAQLAQVKVTAPTQETSTGAVLQRGPRVQISLLGRSLADITVGAALVSATGDCTPDASGTLGEGETAPAVALACTTRKLALIDVLRQGNHVRLYGAADKSLAGKMVSIVFQATGKTVARVRVRKNGGFTTTAPLPRAGIRTSNRARYVARVAGEKSLNLKLARRMIVTSITAKGGSVAIKGKVIRPLAKPAAPIVLKRRVTCKKLQTIKTFKPRRDGTFRVTVKKPANLAAAIYRLQTRVRRTPSSTKTSPTFTLPRAVDL